MTAGAFGTAHAHATVVPYHDILLAYAKSLAAHDRHPGAGVIVAATACEVACQRAMSLALKATVNGDVQADKIHRALRSSSFHIAETRQLYEVLTGVPFTNGPSPLESSFWNDYRKKLVEPRNSIAHRGHRPTDEEIRAALGVAERFIGHLNARHDWGK